MTINDVFPGSKAFPETAVLDEKAVEAAANGTRRYVVASPYTEADHLLDLETLDAENQILAQALVDLKCLRDDYATAAYADTFNWDEVVGRVRELAAARSHGWRETSWYIVAFRSRYEQGIDYSHLGDLDKAAHAEATASGGFLKYVLSLFSPPFSRVPCLPRHPPARPLAPCPPRLTKLAVLAGTGLGHRTGISATWRPASGAAEKTPAREAPGPRTRRPSRPCAPCTPSGGSTSTGSSSETACRAGTWSSGQADAVAVEVVGTNDAALFSTPQSPPHIYTHTASPDGAPWICPCTHPSSFDIGVGGLSGMWDGAG